jgi:hypothetical protein
MSMGRIKCIDALLWCLLISGVTVVGEGGAGDPGGGVQKTIKVKV